MQEQLQRRLAELRTQFDTGQSKLAELEQQSTTLRTTLLRISGAIQVLEEELTKAAEAHACDSREPITLMNQQVQSMQG